MFLELNDKDADNIATGSLIREGIKYKFNYHTLPNTRKITKYSPMDGYIRMKATITIKTNDKLDFVIGDNVQLEGFPISLRIGNIDTEINETQLMFLNDVNVSYILDLE